MAVGGFEDFGIRIAGTSPPPQTKHNKSTTPPYLHIMRLTSTLTLQLQILSSCSFAVLAVFSRISIKGAFDIPGALPRETPKPQDPKALIASANT